MGRSGDRKTNECNQNLQNTQLTHEATTRGPLSYKLLRLISIELPRLC
jgi:hypothetical protein